MRSPLLLVVPCFALAIAGCDGGEPPKPVAVTEPVKPAAEVAPAAAAPPAPPAAAPSPTPDELLAGRIRRALRDARAVPGQGVDATVDGGVVTLYGTVGAPDDRGRVGEFVAAIPGVRSVVNKLVVVRGS